MMQRQPEKKLDKDYSIYLFLLKNRILYTVEYYGAISAKPNYWFMLFTYINIVGSCSNGHVWDTKGGTK